jgi:RNA-directed DNA polymerase
MGTTPEFFFVHNLARALLDGAWTRRAMRARARQACLFDLRSLAMLVREVSAHFSDRSPDFEKLLPFLQNLVGFHKIVPGIKRYFLLPAEMTPRWPVPVLSTPGQIAAWLDVPIGRLDWLADLKGLTLKQTEPKLRHYVNVWIPRRRGKPRLLEVPKAQLKAIQRRILHEILDRIPPHEAAHGFRAKRSIVSYVQPHVGRRIVLHFDLRDFFTSVSAARVRAIFRTAGHPGEVAHLLAGLCTTRTPEEVGPPGPRWRLRHLPQGAPTSPALANLAAYRLDLRLQALAQALGANYTRYADDLAFSGAQRLERAAKRIQVLVAVIAAEEGFELHFRKSRFMRQAVRQQLAGVVVNVHPNLRREIYDELKATLHNCVRNGPVSENRAGHADFRRHLLGRIAHVKMLHPPRGAKLQALFDRIIWPM